MHQHAVEAVVGVPQLHLDAEVLAGLLQLGLAPADLGDGGHRPGDDVLQGQIGEMREANPEDASVLDVHEWSLDNLDSRLRKSRRLIWKTSISRYNRNQVLDE